MVILITPAPEPEGAAVRMTPHGDLDLAGGMEFRRCVNVVLNQHRPVHLDVDLAYVTFLDCSGARTLLWADSRMRGRGGTMVVLQPSTSALRLLRLIEVDRRLLIKDEPRRTIPFLAKPADSGSSPN